jgi:diguanylate cyclase (GGDEF)-like protein
VDISQLRSDFSIFIIDADYALAQSLAELLKASGYQDVQFYPTVESAIAMARQNPPHLVLFDFERLESSAESTMVELQTVSSEILCILMIAYKQVLPALQLVSRNLAYDSIVRPFVSTLEIVQKLDRATTRLYYQFASEQLEEQLTAVQSGAPGETVIQEAPAQKLTDASSTSVVKVGGETANAGDSVINEYLSRLGGSKDLDQTIQTFMDAVSRSLEQTPVLYFKYVPSHVSLLISNASWLPIEKFRGIGVDLRKEEPSSLPDFFREPEKLESLKSLIGQVFRQSAFAAFPHQNEGETLGIFVVLGDVAAAVHDERGKIMSYRRGFELAFKRNLILKEKHGLDITDPITGVFNRKHFSLRLDEEISRSRRILLPVSLVTIDIDGVHKLNDRLGFQQTDSILRAIAAILRKTARANDIVGRTGPDEFACILPHTGHLGGAVKAERIRRIIEATRFPLLENKSIGPLTISCGVSEYPSFCNDVEGLVRMADEALAQVKGAGGNKVCLANAPPGFQMDFSPRDSSSGPPIRPKAGGQ